MVYILSWGKRGEQREGVGTLGGCNKKRKKSRRESEWLPFIFSSIKQNGFILFYYFTTNFFFFYHSLR